METGPPQGCRGTDDDDDEDDDYSNNSKQIIEHIWASPKLNVFLCFVQKWCRDFFLIFWT
jgi:hypothetical protein